MNNFITLASNYIYKITEKNVKWKFTKEKPISANTNSLENSKPTSMIVKTPLTNFTMDKKKLFMTDSIIEVSALPFFLDGDGTHKKTAFVASILENSDLTLIS
jgi:hypothetical protein